MCLTKMVRKYRSLWPNWNKIELDPLGTLQAKYECFLFSGLIEDFLGIDKLLHKIIHNSLKKQEEHPDLNNFGTTYSYPKIWTKFW